MIKITIPMTLLDSDTQLQQLAISAVIKGAKPTYDGDNANYPIVPRFMPLDYAKLLVSKGCTVEHMPLFIEVDPSAEVPAGLIGATDEEGNPVTWENWLDERHEVLTRDGRTFVGTNGHNGTDLPLGELVPVFDQLIRPADLPPADETPEI